MCSCVLKSLSFNPQYGNDIDTMYKKKSSSIMGQERKWVWRERCGLGSG